MNANDLSKLLEKLSTERAIALKGETLPIAIAALCREARIYQTSWHDEIGKYDSYMTVVFLDDSSRGTLNTGDGIAVTEAESPEEANCALIVDNDDGKVYDAVTPDHEFCEAYWVGFGHYNSADDVKRYGKGTRVPKEFKIYRIWFKNGQVVREK